MVGVSKMTDEAFAALAARARGARRILEIGTYHGATAAMLALSLPEATVTSVDVFLQVDPENWFRNRASNQRLYVGTAQDFESEGAHGFEVILVDADHHYEPCLADLMTAERILAPAGRIFVHDYQADRWPGVVKAVDEFCARRGWRPVAASGSLVELGRDRT